MTPEELMQPRYKVIAGYPYSEYEVNRIIKNIGEGYCAFLNEYPHIFKKLNWWEERDEKDFPAYIKSKTTGKVLRAVFGRPYKWDNILPATEEEYNNQ